MTATYHNQNLIPFSPIRPRPNPSSLSASDADSHSRPQNPRPGIAPSDANGSNKTNVAPATNGRMYAPYAVNHCPPADEIERRGTAGTGAKKRPPNGVTGNGSKKRLDDGRNDLEEPLNDRGYRGYVVPPIIGRCPHCGAELVRKSRNGRLPKYCSSNCRVAAYRQRQKENNQ